ncbi:MAG: hydrogenase maturation protease [Candidatus Omnitrophica bacterium]|nr:hydrogenase maturation protease [Candidatus Omnitrophota bacterium]
MRKTVIIGIGSILRGDDGVGPRVIDELEKRSLPPKVSLYRGDISGLDLLKILPDYSRAIVIDASEMGLEPGQVRVFSAKEIKKADFDDSFSTHGMAFLETLTLAEKLDLETEITIVGVQPRNTGFDLELSEPVGAGIPGITDIVIGLLQIP